MVYFLSVNCCDLRLATYKLCSFLSVVDLAFRHFETELATQPFNIIAIESDKILWNEIKSPFFCEFQTWGSLWEPAWSRLSRALQVKQQSIRKAAQSKLFCKQGDRKISSHENVWKLRKKKTSFHLQERIVRSHYAPLCSTILLVTACDAKIWHHVLRCSVEPVKELNLCEIRTVENCSSKKSSKSNGATTRRHVLENPSTQLRPLRPVDLTDAIHVVPRCPEPRRARLGTSQGRWRRELDEISFCSSYLVSKIYEIFVWYVWLRG